MKSAFVLLLVSTLLIPNISSAIMIEADMAKINPSCTIFTVAIGDTVFFGNNEDWRGQPEIRLWFIPSYNLSVIGGTRSI